MNSKAYVERGEKEKNSEAKGTEIKVIHVCVSLHKLMDGWS